MLTRAPDPDRAESLLPGATGACGASEPGGVLAAEEGSANEEPGLSPEEKAQKLMESHLCDGASTSEDEYDPPPSSQISRDRTAATAAQQQAKAGAKPNILATEDSMSVEQLHAMVLR